MSSPQKAIFLDRDGTIIEDTHYPKDPNKVKLLAGAADALKQMSKLGFALGVVSNQSGVARGIISQEQFEAVHKRFKLLIEEHMIDIFHYGYCFHHPDDACDCRKPAIGMVPKQINGSPIDWDKSYIVGDRKSDLELADNLGAKGILVLTGMGEETAQAIGKDTYSTYAGLQEFVSSLKG